jgi:hypothetical protein
MKDHLVWAEDMSTTNDAKHDLILTRLEDAMAFQIKLRWTIGIASTMLGIILMILYHYLPWIWDSLPKHGHTH